MKSKGLIIMNLGSPESYAVRDVRKYLNEFLLDERVMDMPALQRNILVRAFINPFRAPKSAHAYQSVWTEKGSPLVAITNEFASLVEPQIIIPLAVAMRYGKPKPIDALNELEKKSGEMKEILLAPMYPHYAMSSTETAVELAKKQLFAARPKLKLSVLKPFYQEPDYISSLAASIKPYLNKEFDAILFSYHGLPFRHIQKTDPTKSHCRADDVCCEVNSTAWNFCYRHQVRATTRLVSEKLNLEKEKVRLSFQSRLGSGWLEPFTDVVLEELPKKNIKRLLVIAPSFVADCLETLEEIQMRGKESFIASGGEEFVYAPCMNTQTQWVQSFSDWVNYADGKYSGLWEKL